MGSSKVVIVTGGSQGVGASTVEAFLKQGAKVASLDVVQPASSPENDDFLAITCNVASEEQVNLSVEQVLTKWGRIDVLVNNAGITDDNKSVADSTLAVWRRVMGINLEGPMFLMRAVMPHMLKNEMPERGSIVNVCSAAAARGAVAGAAYTSAKHGLLGLTRNTAWMHRHDGIRCNAVLPGGIRTNIVENSGSMIDLSNLGPIAPFMACVPGLVEPEEVANTIVFLATAGSVNGAELTIDNGWLAA